MQHGYALAGSALAGVVPHDAVYDRSATSHAVNLFDMASRYAEVASTDEALRMLESLN